MQAVIRSKAQEKALIVIETVGDFMYLLMQVLRGVFMRPFRYHDVMKQIFFVANESMFIVGFCVAFAAMVTILESSFHMKLVIQNDSMVPGFAAILILRELGAVVSALLLTSRVGAGWTAEVGTMQITEQIDALKMLGINPIRYLVVPRFIACVVGATIVTVVANLFCLYCSMLVSKTYLGFSPQMFVMAMLRFVHFRDLIFAAIKGATFGAVIPIISCFFGFRCKAGAEGVGNATTNSVVASSVAIIVIDFILSYTFSGYY